MSLSSGTFGTWKSSFEFCIPSSQESVWASDDFFEESAGMSAKVCMLSQLNIAVW